MEKHQRRDTDVEIKCMGSKSRGEIGRLGFSLFSSVTQSCPTLQPHELQHARPPCRVSDAIQPSHPLSFPFPPDPNPSQHQGLFQWVNSSHEVAKVLEVQPQHEDWSPLGWTGWISLHSKGLSRVFSNITVQKHQFFGAQLSSQSNSHIHTWPLEKP